MPANQARRQPPIPTLPPPPLPQTPAEITVGQGAPPSPAEVEAGMLANQPAPAPRTMSTPPITRPGTPAAPTLPAAPVSTGPRRSPLPAAHPSAQWGTGEKILGTLFPSYTQGAEQRQQYDIGLQQTEQGYRSAEATIAGQGLVNTGRGIANQQSRLSLEQAQDDELLQEQYRLRTGIGQVAAALLQGRTGFAEQAINANDALKEAMGIPPNAKIVVVKEEDGSGYGVYQRDADRKVVGGSYRKFSPKDLTTILDWADEGAAAAELKTGQARAGLERQPTVEETRDYQAQTGLSAAQHAYDVQPLRQATASAADEAALAQARFTRDQGPVRQTTQALADAAAQREAEFNVGRTQLLEDTQRLIDQTRSIMAENGKGQAEIDRALAPLQRTLQTLQAATQVMEAVSAAENQPTELATAAVTTASALTTARAKAMGLAYNAWRVNPAEGLRALTDLGLTRGLAGTPARIEEVVDEKGNKTGKVRVVGANDETLKYEDGTPAEYDWRVFIPKGDSEWTGTAWGKLNKVTGETEVLNPKWTGVQGVNVRPSATPAQRQAVTTANRLITLRFQGAYDTMTGKYSFGPGDADKARTAYTLAEELIQKGFYSNAAFNLATRYADEFKNDYPAARTAMWAALKQTAPSTEGRAPQTAKGFVEGSGAPPNEGGTSGAIVGQGAGNASAPSSAASPGSPTGGSQGAAPVPPPAARRTVAPPLTPVQKIAQTALDKQSLARLQQDAAERQRRAAEVEQQNKGGPSSFQSVLDPLVPRRTP